MAVVQPDQLAAVPQPEIEISDAGGPGEGFQGFPILTQDEESLGLNERPIGQHEGVLVVPVPEEPAGEIGQVFTRIVQLDPIPRIPLLRGMVVDLVDHHRRGG